MNRLGTRGETAAVGKVLEALIVTLYIAVLTAVLFGSVVPEYQTAAGVELGERVLAQSSTELQQAPAVSNGTAQVVVTLPDTIRGDSYRIHASDHQLRLDHPQAAISTTQSLVMPPGVRGVNGTWNSTGTTVIDVYATDRGRFMRLHNENMTQTSGNET